jgi:hypothetical protein
VELFFPASAQITLSTSELFCEAFPAFESGVSGLAMIPTTASAIRALGLSGTLLELARPIGIEDDDEPGPPVPLQVMRTNGSLRNGEAWTIVPAEALSDLSYTTS